LNRILKQYTVLWLSVGPQLGFSSICFFVWRHLSSWLSSTVVLQFSICGLDVN